VREKGERVRLTYREKREREDFVPNGIGLLGLLISSFQERPKDGA